MTRNMKRTHMWKLTAALQFPQDLATDKMMTVERE